MRLTIDAVPLLVRSAGVKNYYYHWVRQLREEAHEVDIRLFPFLPGPSRLDHEGSISDRFTTFVRLGLLFGLNHAPFNLSGWLVPQCDVFHACKLLNPPSRAKLTATVHDFTCWVLPETHFPKNVAADQRFAERILRRADGIIAVSESTRQDAIRILKVAPEKIRAIYHGIAPEFFSVPRQDSEAVCSRLGLARPYLLFVGTIEPRKNLDLLLDAFERLPRSIREEFDLIVAGPCGWASPQTVARLGAIPGVRYLGYIAEGDLPGLFAGATAFVYPSLYEGFGFPVAQAMAAGTPVITSEVSALPEITGGAALLIDPRSEADLGNAIREMLTSPSRRQELSAAGRTRARLFSWADCARQSLRFFEEVIGQLS
jgi:glycosyltransferase involved in cell wall biosynthesis